MSIIRKNILNTIMFLNTTIILLNFWKYNYYYIKISKINK